jgi:hypothetical protein
VSVSVGDSFAVPVTLSEPDDVTLEVDVFVVSELRLTVPVVRSVDECDVLALLVLDDFCVAVPDGLAVVVLDEVIVLVPLADAVPVLDDVIVDVPVRVTRAVPESLADLEYEGEAEDVLDEGRVNVPEGVAVVVFD